MAFLRILLLLTFCIAEVWTGSDCPPRGLIYPCTCSNLQLTRRKNHTTVTCFGLKNSDQLKMIVPVLGTLDIDSFKLYDAFWDGTSPSAAGVPQNALPEDFVTLTRMVEIEIIDSTMSSCFACHWTTICKNEVTTALKIQNSTSADKICTVCDTGRGSRLPWLPCLSKLKQFQFSHSNLKSLSSDLFPLSMSELNELDFSYNKISKIDRNTFKSLPNLKRLDLSHNLLESIDHTFGQRTALEYLDLSSNVMKVVGSNLIALNPRLKSLNLAHNGITELKQADFRNAPGSLKHIDLTGNPINCDCSLRWVNSTFAVHVAIPGTCATPEEYKDSKLRTTSRNMNERCDERGVLRSRSSLPQRG